MGEANATDAAVPAAARLVRDFVNTVEWQVDEDRWQTPSDLAGWFAERTGSSPRMVTVEDLALARRIREGVRAVLLMHAGHDPLATSIDDLNDALDHVPLRMRFDADGAVGLSAARPVGIAEPLALVVDAIDTSRNDGSWVRLKACSRDSCRWAYWDGSRNISGRWCSMAGCGNYIKMRRRSGRDSAREDAIADGAGSSRVPRLVDVAGRAGVSIKTVSNVVTGAVHVRESTRARVQAAIEELGYRPNLVARALRAGRSFEVPPVAEPVERA